MPQESKQLWSMVSLYIKFQMHRMCDYIRTNWLRESLRGTLSVYGMVHRTNNAVEIYHACLSRLAETWRNFATAERGTILHDEWRQENPKKTSRRRSQTLWIRRRPWCPRRRRWQLHFLKCSLLKCSCFVLSYSLYIIYTIYLYMCLMIKWKIFRR